MSHSVRSPLSRPVRCSLALLVSTTCFSLGAGPVFGQAAAPATEASAKKDEPLKLDAMVVTGSVMPRSNNNVVANLSAPYANYRPVLLRSVVASASYRFSDNAFNRPPACVSSTLQSFS